MYSNGSFRAAQPDLNKIRRNIFLIVFVLNLLGILIIYDASSISAWHTLHDPFYFLKRQLLFSVLGYLAFVLALSINLDTYKKYLPALVGTGLLLLVAVLIPGIGRKIGGARRWIQIFGCNIQPSEIVKFLLVSYTAYCFSQTSPQHFYQRKRGLMLVLAVSAFLLLLEPDLGMVIFLFVFTAAMFFLWGASMRKLLVPLLLGALAVGVLIVVSPYRRARITAFLNPWSDYEGKGFQLIQSQIGFGRGSIWGAGLGNSVQKLFYLPAAYTDFIFSIIGEEFGFVGSLGILALYGAFFYLGYRLLGNIREAFRGILTVAILCMFLFEVAINMGVSVGLFPTKGLPLPFLSYGGSALVVNLFALGILMNASK